jgi:hypothetical protein
MRSERRGLLLGATDRLQKTHSPPKSRKAVARNESENLVCEIAQQLVPWKAWPVLKVGDDPPHFRQYGCLILAIEIACSSFNQDFLFGISDSSSE